MRLQPGSRIGPYEIGELIGAGGMGEVYRAHDTRLDRTVAIKVLPAALSDDAGRRERFEREARSIAALNHPHICVVHDVGHHDGLDFLVMEHVTGEPLSQRLAKGPLPLDLVIRIGSQIADAVDHAHRSGIVHRDLKPANIILTGSAAQPRAKLLDFGLAKLIAPAVAAGSATELTHANTDRELTAEGAVVGTLHYMAPEQLEGGEVDGRTDIFALGSVLYEMATSRKAFDGKSTASVVAAILEHQPTPISSLRPLTPPAFEHVVSTCLAKSPDDRWQAAGDVAKQLQWVAAGPESDIAPRSSRHRVPIVAIATGAGVLVAAAVMAWWFMRTNEPKPLMRFEVATPPVVNPALLPMIALSPDGVSIAYVGVVPGTSTQALWVRKVDALDAQRLPGTDGANSPFWSPDSRQIGFAAQGVLKRVDLQGGPPQTICDISGNFGGGTWNASDTIVFGGLSPLMRVAAKGGLPTPLTIFDTAAGETAHVWPRFLPDGRHILFLAGSPGNTPRRIMVVDVDAPAAATEIVAANSNPLYSPAGYLLFHRDGTLLAQRFDVSTFELRGDPIRIADGLAFAPAIGRAAVAVSDTGLLAFRTGAAFEPSRLAWYDREGTATGFVGAQAIYRGLGLSPDGESLAVHIHEEPTGGDIWVADLRRGNSTRYTFSAHNFAPSWSRDGRYVMFSSDRDGDMKLYRKPTDAAGGDEMMLGTGTAAFVEDLTPDGEWMVYGVQTGANGMDVMRAPLNRQGDPEVVVSSAFFDGLAKIAPDGRWIAYESDETGRREIYVRPYPTGAAKWQISTGGGRYVRWSPKGGELFYLKDDGMLMAAEVRVKGDALTATTPKPLFRSNVVLSNHRGSQLDIPYDVSGDARRFIVNERVAPGAAQYPITVVVNWTSLLTK